MNYVKQNHIFRYLIIYLGHLKTASTWQFCIWQQIHFRLFKFSTSTFQQDASFPNYPVIIW